MGQPQFQLVQVRRLLDHYRFPREDLVEEYTSAHRAGAELIVTTEKDAEVEILRGADDFQDAVGKICFPRGTPANEA